MNSPFSAGDSVFGYGRDSGGDQQDLSIAQQEQALRSWALEHGLILSHFYADEARKGSTLIGRDQLQAMMHRFRHGCTERGVIVWKYNRFARSIDNAQFLRAEIRTLGYLFHSITDQVPDGPMGRIFEAVVDFKDEQFLLDLSIDVKRGLRDLVVLHGCMPGTPPRGFLRQPVDLGPHRDGRPHVGHRWRPDPDLAPRILQAFELRLGRTPLAQIQNQTRLYSAINSWRTFFSNPLYTGVLVYGGQRIEDYCDPIVPSPIWEGVQAVQNGYLHRSHLYSTAPDHPRRTGSRFLLSGPTFCALCGSPLFGLVAVHRNGHRYDNYACPRRYRNRDCTAPRIPKSTLEDAVLDTLRDYVLRPDVFAQALSLATDSHRSLDLEHAAQSRQLTGELATVRRQLTNIADGIAANGPSATLNARLGLLESQRLELEFKLAALASDESAPPPLTTEEFGHLTENIGATFPAADDETKRTILRGFIDRIDVAREDHVIHGTIFYFYPPGPAAPKADAPGMPLVRHTPGAPRYTHAVAFSAPVILNYRRKSRP